MVSKKKYRAPTPGAIPSDYRHPRITQLPAAGLSPPRAEEIPFDYTTLEFRAEKMDMGGSWGWANFRPDKLQDFLNKVFQCQKLTWQE